MLYVRNVHTFIHIYVNVCTLWAFTSVNGHTVVIGDLQRGGLDMNAGLQKLRSTLDKNELTTAIVMPIKETVTAGKSLLQAGQSFSNWLSKLVSSQWQRWVRTMFYKASGAFIINNSKWIYKFLQWAFLCLIVHVILYFCKLSSVHIKPLCIHICKHIEMFRKCQKYIVRMDSQLSTITICMLLF